MMNFTRTGAAAIVLAVAVAGCVDVTAPRGAIAGEWSLAAANGAPPPVLLFEAGGDSLQLVGMTFAFDRNGSYVSTGLVRSVAGGVVVETSGTDHGVWTVTGDSLTLRSLEGGISSLDIQPDRLSFVNPTTGFSMTFSRAHLSEPRTGPSPSR
ncbi:MAG TPA: hypothetical protein VIV65_04650 [Gemmatimonadaceae bacterium]